MVNSFGRAERHRIVFAIAQRSDFHRRFAYKITIIVGRSAARIELAIERFQFPTIWTILSFNNHQSDFRRDDIGIAQIGDDATILPSTNRQRVLR